LGEAAAGHGPAVAMEYVKSAGPGVDRDLAGAAGAAGPTVYRRDAFANLAASLDTVARRSGRLTADARGADAGAPGGGPGARSGVSRKRLPPSIGTIR
jgi:hypothetical protein